MIILFPVQPSPARFRARPPKLRPQPRPSSGSHDNSAFNSSKVHKRHNSDISLSTIAEETGSHLNTSLGQDSLSSSEDNRFCTPVQSSEPGSVQSSYNGTSVFLEPHITVETSTLPAQVRMIVTIMMIMIMMMMMMMMMMIMMMMMMMMKE